MKARLTLVLDCGNPDPAGEPITAAEEKLKAAPAPVVGKRKAILDQAQTGALPQAPDFSNLDLSGFCSGQVVMLGGLFLKAMGDFQPIAECLRRGPVLPGMEPTLRHPHQTAQMAAG